MDVTHFVGEIDDEGLMKELETFKHFLEHSERENGRHTVFNFAVEICTHFEPETRHSV